MKLPAIALTFALLVSGAVDARTFEMDRCDTDDCASLFERYHTYARTHADAAAILGDMYLNGYGTEPDAEEALSLFKRAARWRSMQGMYKAGQLMIESDDPDDVGDGLDYLRNAAKREHRNAKFLLAQVYSDPKYGMVDLEEADVWLAESIEDGHPLVNFPLHRLQEAGQLTPNQFPRTLEKVEVVNAEYAATEQKQDNQVILRDAPADDKYEVITVNGPKLEEMLTWGLSIFSTSDNDIRQRTTGTRIRGKTCDDLWNCTSVFKTRFRRKISYEIQ
ncbi:tetratricopeptide repeat protein [Alteromonas sp. H39]|uniref:tetratricopeptide repeat protein n=1 Tax=Alteromonas sp. H39 TaxID=3389876 RepID=UPI0039E1B07C